MTAADPRDGLPFNRDAERDYEAELSSILVRLKQARQNYLERYDRQQHVTPEGKALMAQFKDDAAMALWDYLPIIEKALAHARPEAVDEAMVERAYAAFRKHVPSKGHRAGFKQQLHAALTAALTPERAP